MEHPHDGQLWASRLDPSCDECACMTGDTITPNFGCPGPAQLSWDTADYIGYSRQGPAGWEPPRGIRCAPGYAERSLLDGSCGDRRDAAACADVASRGCAWHNGSCFGAQVRSPRTSMHREQHTAAWLGIAVTANPALQRTANNTLPG